MQFVLPFNFKNLHEIPVPTNSKVAIRSVPGRIIAVSKFSGYYNREYCEKQYMKLKDSLVARRLLHKPLESEPERPVEWSGTSD
jgi:hypothetical protein